MMKNFQWKTLIPHIIAIVVFLVVALIYCKPALEGKVLQQHDVMQWKGMAQNSFQYKEKHGTFPLWTNGMFSGMPAYQIAMESANPLSLGYIQAVITLGLSKPISFFFLACICFYFLSQVLQVNPYAGIIGALAYAYATYNPVIIAAGHDTKMMAIAYMPAVIGSILLVYEKKYLIGAACTALFAGLLIAANHMQITYYTFIIAGIMSVGYLIHWIKEKHFKHLILSVAIVAIAGLIGVMVNSVSLFTTYEYSKQTIRGGSVLADSKSTVTQTGLSKDYALSYSLYKTEPLVLMFPHAYGGSSNNMEVAEDKSKAIEALQQMNPQLGQQLQGALQFYWGGIDGVGTSGPPYAGAIICFLALMGFAVLDGKHKWWILTAIVLTTMMSWGKYFEDFNVLLLKYLPMYDKFRAPSMIMVVPTLLLGMMAILTIQKIIDTKDKNTLLKPFKKGLIITASIFAIALLLYVSADFSSSTDKEMLKQVSSISDAQQKEAIYQPVLTFINGLKADRQSLLLGTILRSFLFIAVAIVALWLYMKNKISTIVALAAIGIFVLIDIMVIDSKYLNNDHYQDQADSDNIFKPSEADMMIMKDTGYYRVFNISQGIISNAFNAGALNSYFHKSIGGYHPAKLSIYQDLIEKQLYKFPDCMPVINMLNTKYIITVNKQNGQLIAQQNPANLGAVWFVKAVEFKKDPAAVMNSLDHFNPKDTAIVEEKNKSLINITSQPDTTAQIRLVKNDNDFIEYQSKNNASQFAVFSEVFYDKGWKAFIDGKETPIVQTNYVLRGLSVPAGSHTITFEFKPAAYYNSTKLAIISSSLVWLLLIGAAVQAFKKNKEINV
jgi:hypothetical protein